MDPDIYDKIKSEVEYLDEMIKGEQINIIKLSNANLKFRRLDFVQRDVIKERKMVQIEDELMRLKNKITLLQDKNEKTLDQELRIDEQILGLLKTEAELKVHLNILDSSPPPPKKQQVEPETTKVEK